MNSITKISENDNHIFMYAPEEYFTTNGFTNKKTVLIKANTFFTVDKHKKPADKDLICVNLERFGFIFQKYRDVKECVKISGIEPGVIGTVVIHKPSDTEVIDGIDEVLETKIIAEVIQ